MSTTLERLEYGFDRDSRRTWRLRALAAGEDNAYGYDGLSQVVNAARGNLNLNATAIAAVPVAAESWDYDPTGNWQGYHYHSTGTGAVTLDQTRVHDQGNRLTQVAGDPNPVGLDRAGRMVEVPPGASGDWSKSLLVKWDAWSRIVEIKRAEDGSVAGSYAYDGLTRRITRTVGTSTTTHTYYSDAWRPLEERAGSSTSAVMQYYWGARHRDDLVRRDSFTGGGTLNTTRYVLMDYFSPAALTDQNGAVQERYAFSAFGVRRILAPDFTARSTSECGFEFAFQGQFQDNESRLLNYGYRYYSPTLGRWSCKDPIEEEGGLNLYSIVGNTPLRWVDFLGLQRPVYNPSNWNDAGHNAANNCYTYACDRRKPPGTPKVPDQQPGSDAGSPAKSDDCASIEAAARKDGLKIKKGKCCPRGYHEVQSYTGDHVHEPGVPLDSSGVPVDPADDIGSDYHWYRQDSNDKWSSKHGNTPVGPQVSDPKKDAASWGYNKPCKKMCAKD